MNPMVAGLIGNWQMNGILTLRTGQPFGLGSNGCPGTYGVCHPDLVPGKDPKNAPAGGRNPDHWFDTTAVTYPHAQANGFGTPGTLGNQSNSGPPTRTMDVSLFKDFPITERVRVQFRAEGFNIANTPQFSSPDNYLPDANFGKITSTQSNLERHFQLSLRVQF